MNFPIIQQHQDLQQAVSARELQEFLEVKDRFSVWIERQLQYGFVENVDYMGCEVYNKKARQTLQDYKITKSMAAQICAKQRFSDSVHKAIEAFSLNLEHVHTYTRFELSFLEMLSKAVDELGFDYQTQYSVGDYRIDFYIPSLLIAVEYDESHHEGARALRDDSRRQKWITGEIGCGFVRCDYKHDDIRNVMKVVKAIYSKSKI